MPHDGAAVSVPLALTFLWTKEQQEVRDVAPRRADGQHVTETINKSNT